VARKSKNTNNGATLGFEETLWQVATAFEVPNWQLKMRIGDRK